MARETTQSARQERELRARLYDARLRRLQGRRGRREGRPPIADHISCEGGLRVCAEAAASSLSSPLVVLHYLEEEDQRNERAFSQSSGPAAQTRRLD